MLPFGQGKARASAVVSHSPMLIAEDTHDHCHSGCGSDSRCELLGWRDGLCDDEDFAWPGWRDLPFAIHVEIKVPFSGHVRVLLLDITLY